MKTVEGTQEQLKIELDDNRIKFNNFKKIYFPNICIVCGSTAQNQIEKNFYDIFTSKNEYMKNYMREKRKHDKVDPNEDFHYHGKDVFAEREEQRAREIRAKDEQKRREFAEYKKQKQPKLSFEQRLALLEKGSREVNVNFNSQGEILDRTIEDPFEKPQYENQKLTKETEILGANAWGFGSSTSTNKSPIRKQSNQDLLRDQFGDKVE